MRTLQIWTLIKSDVASAVALDDRPPPDVFIIPDIDEEDGVVLVDDDDNDAMALMGILNMDGMPDQ